MIDNLFLANARSHDRIDQRASYTRANVKEYIDIVFSVTGSFIMETFDGRLCIHRINALN